ncbi:MAG: S1 family serine peptidase, partial [Candidatus Nanopelagicales bacterium]
MAQRISTARIKRYSAAAAAMAIAVAAGIPSPAAAATRDEAAQSAVKPHVALNASGGRSGHDRERIVGGEDASIEDAPWQVSLQYSDTTPPYLAHYCGGSIVSAEWIVTAAHCVEDVNPADIAVLAGVTELTYNPLPRKAVAAIVIHPGYDSGTFVNDVALIRLSTALSLDGVTMAAIDLPTGQDPLTWPA